MADARCVRSEAAEGAELFAPIGMTELQAVPGRLRRRPRSEVVTVRVDALDQPVATFQPDDAADLEPVVGDEAADVLLARPVVDDDVVVEVAVLAGGNDGHCRAGPNAMR